jgi:two-component system cell cycle sensor histidine kinase/response regulator CckA
MLDSGVPDPFVLGRILALQGALHEAAGEEQLGQTACRGLLRVPGVGDCAVCVDGKVASSTGELSSDLRALFCGDSLEPECRGNCHSLRSGGLARVALATRRGGYGAMLIRVSDEEQYSLYEPYVDNTARLLGLHIELQRQAAELLGQSANLARQVRARTLELEDSQAQLELAVEGGELGTWDWNVYTGAISYNQRWAGMLGYALPEIETTVGAWERLIHIDDLPGVKQAIRAHLDGKTPFYQSEHRLRHRSGEWVWVLDRGKVVEHDEVGRPSRMCGTHLDITDRKAAEQALQWSERRLRLALEAGAMGTWEWNLETDEATWSEEHYRLFGLEPGQFGGTRDAFMRCVLPADLPGLLAEADRCRQARLPFQHECRVVRPDGSERWISARGTFTYDSSGKATRLLGVVWDVTERRRAEAERLRQTAAIEQAAESFVIVDRNGFVEYVNPSFERLFGVSRREVVGQPWDVLKGHRPSDEERYAAVRAVITTGKTWSGRVVLAARDGTPITVDCSVSPVLGNDGELEHIVLIHRDITAQVQMEEQLRQAQKIESIGRLAAGVAHDFNNMLTPILGYTEMLLAGMHPVDVRYAQLLEIKKAAECSRDLTRQLVAFSRKQVLQMRAVDLRAIVSGIEQLLRRTLRKNVALRTRLSPAACPVTADVGQIEQVLMNLAVNAQDAMPEGGELLVEVSPAELDAAFCAAHHGAKPGRYGALIVSDTGHGMDEETRQHAFEPFFSTKSDQGTGLGLATVYGVVKQHAGSIWIESGPGKGARFSIYLPEASAKPEATSEQSAERRVGPGTETILVVEDNDMVRRLTQSLLQMQGYKVLAASNGQEALSAAEAGAAPIDLLLADVVMPDMNGPDLAVKLREKRPTLKVLFMSGYSDNAVEQHGVLEVDTDFIQKPFSVGGLAAKLREVLDRPM